MIQPQVLKLGLAVGDQLPRFTHNPGVSEGTEPSTLKSGQAVSNLPGGHQDYPCGTRSTLSLTTFSI